MSSAAKVLEGRPMANGFCVSWSSGQDSAWPGAPYSSIWFSSAERSLGARLLFPPVSVAFTRGRVPLRHLLLPRLPSARLRGAPRLRSNILQGCCEGKGRVRAGRTGRHALRA